MSIFSNRISTRIWNHRRIEFNVTPCFCIVVSRKNIWKYVWCLRIFVVREVSYLVSVSVSYTIKVWMMRMFCMCRCICLLNVYCDHTQTCISPQTFASMAHRIRTQTVEGNCMQRPPCSGVPHFAHTVICWDSWNYVSRRVTVPNDTSKSAVHAPHEMGSVQFTDHHVYPIVGKWVTSEVSSGDGDTVCVVWLEANRGHRNTTLVCTGSFALDTETKECHGNGMWKHGYFVRNAAALVRWGHFVQKN